MHIINVVENNRIRELSFVSTRVIGIIIEFRCLFHPVISEFKGSFWTESNLVLLFIIPILTLIYYITWIANIVK